MMSTCISDFCSGVSWYYTGLFDVREGFHGKNDTNSIAPTFLGISYLVILAAQTDRYHAVASPFHYSQRMTPCKTILVIVCLWTYAYFILAVQICVADGIAVQITAFGTLICNIITLGIMIGLNIKLYLIAKHQLNREPPSSERENKRASLYLIVVVAGCFLLFWLPLFLRLIVCHFQIVKCKLFYNDGSDPTNILPRINCALTPCLYLGGCTPLRKVVFGKIRSSCCKRWSVCLPT
uniref:G-protein coupled receptors family 1 profile domain-containing protein n=1 Tax=Latimeria chalumnae TaxID=7897 RepID=H3AW00_LATCH